MKSATFTRLGSYSTVAVEVAKFTLARSTPAVFPSFRSMVRAQAAHVIPETGRSTRCGVVTFMRALRIQDRGRLRPALRVSPGPRHIPLWRWPPGDPRRPGSRRGWTPRCAPRYACSCGKSFRGRKDAEFGSPYLYDALMRHTVTGGTDDFCRCAAGTEAGGGRGGERPGMQCGAGRGRTGGGGRLRHLRRC